MANAKICDRCGVVYSVPLKHPDICVFNSKPPHLSNEFYDLCDGCTDQLRDFMNTYKEVVNAPKEKTED